MVLFLMTRREVDVDATAALRANLRETRLTVDDHAGR